MKLPTILLPVSTLASFHYGPTADWAKTHGANQGGECDGQVQSPIDISSSSALPNTHPDNIPVTNFFQTQVKNKIFKLQTDPIDQSKHALKFSFDAATPLHTDQIKCAQFHFHIEKSEHTLNSQHFLAELHLVCFQSKFADLGAAVASKESNALMVFGSWIQEDENLKTHNQQIDNVISAYNNFENNQEDPILDNQFQIPMPGNIQTYYRYDGSLTTPTCNEVVTWTVFKNPILITSDQAAVLKSMRAEVIHNNRPTLPLNGREVVVYGENEFLGHEKTVSYVVVGIAVLLVVIRVLLPFLCKKKVPEHTAGEKVDELV